MVHELHEKELMSTNPSGAGQVFTNVFVHELHILMGEVYYFWYKTKSTSLVNFLKSLSAVTNGTLI